MKKSELRQIIKEELTKVMYETTKKIDKTDPNWFNKLYFIQPAKEETKNLAQSLTKLNIPFKEDNENGEKLGDTSFLTLKIINPKNNKPIYAGKARYGFKITGKGLTDKGIEEGNLKQILIYIKKLFGNDIENIDKNIDFPEMEDEYNDAMKNGDYNPKDYLQELIDSTPNEIISNNYYELLNAVEQGVYTKDEAVNLAKTWAKEKLKQLK